MIVVLTSQIVSLPDIYVRMVYSSDLASQCALLSNHHILDKSLN